MSAHRCSPLDIQELRARGTRKWTQFPPDVLPIWIAESDFDTCPAVLNAVQEGSRRQYFGYPTDLPALGEALSSWCLDAYGWSIDPSSIVGVPDVVRGLRLAITHFTPPGSSIVIPTPAYTPFFALLEVCSRPGVFVPMIEDDSTGRWVFDLDGLERAYANGVGSMILCNPYNPLGTAFTADELRAVTDLAAQYNVRVFSDEIHGPMVYDRPHIPTASVSETAARITITATATSKGWNTAGLKCAQLIFSNPDDKTVWDTAVNFLDKEGVSTLGQLAAIGAYTEGREWLQDEIDYLRENKRLLVDGLSHIPNLRTTDPEATFLLWVDMTDVVVPGSPVSGETFGESIRRGGPTPEQWLVTHAKLAPNDGAAFAEPGAQTSQPGDHGDLPHGVGCIRINFATSREICQEIVTTFERLFGTSHS
ncbi:MalY/PatB family protein [Corynebacterium kroppenstedtii]|uniref:MalY/PatB family protein n=1 Tax=Corynebacterium sp. PCR 32 TaxID=3351342 RepID=UPI003095AD3D